MIQKTGDSDTNGEQVSGKSSQWEQLFNSFSYIEIHLDMDSSGPNRLRWNYKLNLYYYYEDRQKPLQWKALLITILRMPLCAWKMEKRYWTYDEWRVNSWF